MVVRRKTGRHRIDRHRRESSGHLHGRSRGAAALRSYARKMVPVGRHAVAKGRDEAGLPMGAREGAAGGMGARAEDRGAGRESIVRGRRGAPVAGTGGHSRSRTSVGDSDPWLLGTPDGVIDLRTGATQEARPGDYITRLTAVAPAEGEDCPLWMAFLSEATGNDADMIGFLQRWFGYCLTGITREHALVFIHGDGGNGKGVLMNTVFGIMGGHAANAVTDTFVVTRGDKHTTDLAMLDGARMVMASEVEEGQTWAEARIKAITGGDPITARFMRQDNFTFVPRFKLTISGNHKPALRGVDNSTRRRFNIVPFTRRPATPDPELSEKLKTEWGAILRWMIEGCLEWQRSGPARPRPCPPRPKTTLSRRITSGGGSKTAATSGGA